jgi:alpha/beta superfamily hydrolase
MLRVLIIGADGIHFITAIAILVTAFCNAMTPSHRLSGNLEETVCGWFTERAAFFSWSITAGRPKLDAWKTIPGSEPVAHKTIDGRTLRGFKIAGVEEANASSAKRSFMLFAQGNAMLADQSLDTLVTFAANGLDVFVYDYRGYGSSEGKRRLKAIISDYQEIFDVLKKRYTGRKYLYGVSFGGLVLLNVIGRGAEFDRAVIDSTPSRVSGLGCPQEYDPVLNLPSDATKLFFISGEKDAVVTAAAQRELTSTAQSRGASVFIGEEFAHAFGDLEDSVHQKRQNMIKVFLLANSP